MTIAKSGENQQVTLALEGRLDTTTAPQLEEAVRNIMEGTTALTLDLEKLEYISSAGLRVVLSTQKMMMSAGSMTVTNVSDSVMEVFNITGFADILVFG